MTAATTIKTTKPRKSAEEALAALQAKQKALNLKASKLQKEIDERKQAASQAQRVRLGKLAADAGLHDLTDEVLKKAFEDIGAKNGIKRPTPELAAA